MYWGHEDRVLKSRISKPCPGLMPTNVSGEVEARGLLWVQSRSRACSKFQISLMYNAVVNAQNKQRTTKQTKTKTTQNEGEKWSRTLVEETQRKQHRIKGKKWGRTLVEETQIAALPFPPWIKLRTQKFETWKRPLITPSSWKCLSSSTVREIL